MDGQGGVRGDESAGIGAGDLENKWDGIVAVSFPIIYSFDSFDSLSFLGLRAIYTEEAS